MLLIGRHHNFKKVFSNLVPSILGQAHSLASFGISVRFRAQLTTKNKETFSKQTREVLSTSFKLNKELLGKEDWHFKSQIGQFRNNYIRFSIPPNGNTKSWEWRMYSSREIRDWNFQLPTSRC